MLEKAHVFSSRGKKLVAMEHIPEIKPALTPSTNTSIPHANNKGVVIVVGGPQTRVGSHRLFVYLARKLAEQGVHVYRFDYTGAGDSEGEITEFMDIQADIAAAVEHFQQLQPHITKLTLWGLCDAASAILLYLAFPLTENVEKNSTIDSQGSSKECTQKRSTIYSVILVNPWVRQAHTQAKVYLKSYYVKRFFSHQFWMKLFKGKVKTLASFNDLRRFHQQSKQNLEQKNFVDQMWQGLSGFSGKSHVILSENDLVADEFTLLIENNNDWQALITNKVSNTETIKFANHTFSGTDSQYLLFEKTLSALLSE